ncbi:MAG: caspase family protein [Treponema sp.]|nr:caspase family protein [Treponema sp.]
MKRFFTLLLFGLTLLPVYIIAQQNNSQTANTPLKFALVIGNGAYTNLGQLANPVNDANDIADTLQSLGFTVDRLINASLDQMDTAVMRLKNRLSVSQDSYGFFYYAGHGVQSSGENYLIPVDASIPGENFLRSRSLSVQAMLAELNDAGNNLNVVVLDACRDNPFGWGRGGNRGLALVDNQPADSIIVFATSAGQTAMDGTGRNGLFTSQLLPNLKTPGLEINEIFRRTMGDVMRVSSNSQRPAIYNQFPGLAVFYPLPPAPPPPVVLPPAPAVAAASPVAAPAPAAAPPAPAGVASPLPAPAVTAPVQTTAPAAEPSAVAAAPPAEPPPASQPAAAVQAAAPESEPSTARQAQPVVTARPAPLPSPSPQPVVPPKTPKTAAELKMTRLNSLGAAIGSSFAIPWFVGTVEGTFAPWNYTFFDLGIDLGTWSGKPDINQFSTYLFAHFAFFVPFAKSSGWYAGVGAGIFNTSYNFSGLPEVSATYTAFDIKTGLIFNGFIIAYSLRTNFNEAGHNIVVGYLYRFK